MLPEKVPMTNVRRILVVDDEPEFRFAARIALRKAGYEVDLAGNGREALSALLAAREAGETIDLLVLDIRMPTMSGIELMRELRRREIFPPILVMTCFGDRTLLAELKQEGLMEVIEKPFGPQELVSRVAGLLE